MSWLLAMIATLLGLAPGPYPAAPAFEDPGCEQRDDAAKRQRCYFDTIARYPHLWKHRPDDAILKWHADKAEHIFNDGILREGLDGQALKYTDASENMFRTSMILVTDVRDEDAAPHNAAICKYARKALDRACKVTYCADDQDTPAASASVGDSAAMAERMYETACPDDWAGCPPSPNFSTPSYCKGVDQLRLAVAQRLERLMREERETKELESLLPGLEVGSDVTVLAWKREVVDLAVDLEDEIASGTFDEDRYAQKIGEYQQRVERPGVIATKQRRLAAISSYGEVPEPSEATVDREKLEELRKKRKEKQKVQPKGSTERFYLGLDQQEAKALSDLQRRLGEHSK